MKRARNQEVIRQFNLLRELESSRYGRTLAQLAEPFGVHQRTIRRDLEALQEVGFAIESRQRDGRTVWSLNRETFKALADAGLTLPELFALYLSRALVTCLAGTPFQRDLETAFEKFEQCLTPAQLQYLDTLPAILTAKEEARKKAADPSVVSALVRARLDRKRLRMTYDSFTSGRVKDYTIEPYRIVYGQGGLYLLAIVREYGDARLFAVERIQRLRHLEEHFEPNERLVKDALTGSLGINLTGRREAVEIEFHPAAARYVVERAWHPSQAIEALPDGSVRLRMKVIVDWALTSWVLGFGPHARVVAPKRLAALIYERLEETRLLYAPPIPLEPPSLSARGPRLPFSSRSTRRAR